VVTIAKHSQSERRGHLGGQCTDVRNLSGLAVPIGNTVHDVVMAEGHVDSGSEHLLHLCQPSPLGIGIEAA